MSTIFKVPFAATTQDVTAVPEPMQPNGSVSFTEGFGPDYGRDNQDPLKKDIPRGVFNWLLREVTASIFEIQRHGAAIWSADAKPYPVGAAVYHNGALLVSTAANNNNNPPHATWINLRPDPSEFRIPGLVYIVAGQNIPNWLLIGNGAAVSRTAYSGLFAEIGTTFGAGDGSTTFNLPDFRGAFLRGFGGNSAAFGQIQADAIKQHNHPASASWAGDHSHIIPGANWQSPAFLGGGHSVYVSRDVGNSTTSTAGGHSHSITIGNTGGVETRPLNMALHFCISI